LGHVKTSLLENGPANALPRASDFDSFTLPELEAAIRRSQEFLLREQKPEGYWVGELIVDCTLVADMVAYHHWNKSVDEKWQRKAVHHIFSLQLLTGGWSIYPGGPAEVNATIKAYLALKLAGVPPTDSRMLRARQTALSLGGVPRLNTFSKLYLALLDLFPWKYVPTIPCEVILIGWPSSTISNPPATWDQGLP
jgi:squalene-hopene/tetraprenyl-beta-curcumene cyclase